VAGIALGIGLVFYQLADRPLGQLAGRLRPRIIRNAAAATS